MDGKTYDELRKKVLDRIEFDGEIARNMLAFATELVVHLNQTLQKSWNAFELGQDLNGIFSREIPKAADQATLPFSVAVTFANKSSGAGRSYGHEHRISVPFVIEWKSHYFEVRCIPIEELGVTFARYEIKEKRVLEEVSAMFDKAVSRQVEEYVAQY